MATSCLKFIIVFVSIFGFLIIPVWAVHAQNQADLEKALLDRANEYWTLKVKGNMEKAYQFEDPDTVKDVTMEKYGQSIGGAVKWLKARATKAELLKDNYGGVIVELNYVWTFTPEHPKDGFQGVFWDHWRLVDNTWYHLYKAPSYSNLVGAPQSVEPGSAPPAAPGPAAPLEPRQEQAQPQQQSQPDEDKSAPEKENSQPGQQSSAPEESKSEEGSPQPEKQDI